MHDKKSVTIVLKDLRCNAYSPQNNKFCVYNN